MVMVIPFEFGFGLELMQSNDLRPILDGQTKRCVSNQQICTIPSTLYTCTMCTIISVLYPYCTVYYPYFAMRTLVAIHTKQYMCTIISVPHREREGGDASAESRRESRRRKKKKEAPKVLQRGIQEKGEKRTAA